MFRKFFIILGIFGIAIIAAIAVFDFKKTDYVAVPTVVVHTKNGDKEFIVELAKTQEEQAKGLMYREFLEKTNGMLFILDKPRTVKFWMKNTLIPLDMIFIDENLKIVHIENHAIPCPQNAADCPLYSSIMPIKYVLEIGEDLTKTNNIEVGNNVSIDFGS